MSYSLRIIRQLFKQLSLSSYQEYKINDYCLDLLPDENHFFVVSPKDVVVASLLENDDLVAWLIEHR